MTFLPLSHRGIQCPMLLGLTICGPSACCRDIVLACFLKTDLQMVNSSGNFLKVLKKLSSLSLKSITKQIKRLGFSFWQIGVSLFYNIFVYRLCVYWQMLYVSDRYKVMWSSPRVNPRTSFIEPLHAPFSSNYIKLLILLIIMLMTITFTCYTKWHLYSSIDYPSTKDCICQTILQLIDSDIVCFNTHTKMIGQLLPPQRHNKNESPCPYISTSLALSKPSSSCRSFRELLSES